VLIREFAIPIEDLTRLAIDCPQCKSTMIVDLDADTPLSFCSICHLDFQDRERNDFRTLARVLASMKAGRYKFSFRVPGTEDAPQRPQETA